MNIYRGEIVIFSFHVVWTYVFILLLLPIIEVVVGPPLWEIKKKKKHKHEMK